MKHRKKAGWGGIVATLAATLVTLGLLGCGVQQLTRGELEAPKVNFRGVIPGMPSPEGWPLRCLLTLENLNQQPLDIRGYDYEVWLEGRRVAQGASSHRVYLPPRGKSEVEFPVLVKLPAVMNLAPQVLNRRRVNYQVAGGFRLASVMGGFIRIPFHFRGETTLDEGMEMMRLYVK